MNKEGHIGSALTTSDEKGRRLWVYPADVKGKYRSRKSWVSAVLLLVFLLLPWVKIHGRQALLLDFWNGRFSVLGLGFWSHDAPMLMFIFGGAAVLLAFVTSVWGRLWCGWACPQTVFVDLVFRRVERWIEGDAFVRRRRDAGPWTGQKVLKKSLTWGIYVLISLVLSHGFLAYFIGTEALIQMMGHSPSQNLGSFAAMAGITLAVLFDFGWLREQFCTLICPYGRFQSVLMDEKSLAVTYDRARGEPRRGTVPFGITGGDCVNCLRCVQVCPTGIDIRNGLQLECIACTACIDACDAVMTKVKKPTGLIRYTSGRSGSEKHFTRPAAYLAVLSVLLGGLAWTVIHREPVEITLIRAIGAPYAEVIRAQGEKEVTNHFKLDLLNQTFEPVRIEVPASDPLGVQVVSAALPVELKPGESKKIDFFLRFPLSKLKEGRGRMSLETVLSSPGWKNSVVKQQEVPLVGPLR